MGIDVKHLHIGAHVLVGDKRVKVLGITQRKIGYHDVRADGNLRYARLHEVEPIEITPALLEELGFEWSEDMSCWRRYDSQNEVDYNWGIYAVHNRLSGVWSFDVYLPDFIRPRFYARHLHEIEGQLAYYGIELLND